MQKLCLCKNVILLAKGEVHMMLADWDIVIIHVSFVAHRALGRAQLQLHAAFTMESIGQTGIPMLVSSDMQSLFSIVKHEAVLIRYVLHAACRADLTSVTAYLWHCYPDPCNSLVTWPLLRQVIDILNSADNRRQYYPCLCILTKTSPSSKPMISSASVLKAWLAQVQNTSAELRDQALQVERQWYQMCPQDYLA